MATAPVAENVASACASLVIDLDLPHHLREPCVISGLSGTSIDGTAYYTVRMSGMGFSL